ncbi:tetratricopeptide repeat protein [Actinosynnema sp. NPDC020468]|uniref:tetratricopeptide repeat protein n=1 Tax=Actinosynnema sp. NPDC020468 TaxID=3154488 RepID=UPI0033F7D0A5
MSGDFAVGRVSADRDAYVARTQFFDRPPYLVEPFAPAEPAPDGHLREVAPSEWLAARTAVVDFVGREDELAALTRWARSDAPRAVRVLHADGGAGKTRLADRFAREVDLPVVTARYGRGRHGGGEVDTASVLLVDYADRWPRSALERLLCEDFATRDRVRVLLLARTAGPWWDGLRSPLRDSGYELSHHELTADDGERRAELFDSAVRRFADVWGLAEADRPTGVDPRHTSALTVLMGALVQVDAAVRGVRPPTDPGELSSYLRDREHAHWAKLAEAGQVDATPREMARVVALGTLLGGVDYAEALKVLRYFGLADSDAAAGRLLDAHTACYPPDSGAVLRPMRPDRLGEDFLASLLPGPGAGDGGAAHLVRTVLLDGRPDFAPRRHAAWTTVTDTGARWPHIRDLVLGLLTEDPGLDVGAPALTAVAGFAPIGLLVRVEQRFPVGRHVELDVAMADVARRVTAHRLSGTADPAARARLHFALSVRLADAGDAAPALDHARKAVELHRAHGRESLPELGIAWNNLGFRLSDLGRHEDALAATREAVRLSRVAAEVAPDLFTSPYAVALSNFAVDLNRMNRFAEAADAAERAREILERDPKAVPHLALALWNQAEAFAGAGRSAEAVDLLRRSVGLFAELAATAPSTHLPELVRARTRLAHLLVDTDVEAARTEADAAVRAGRALHATNPAAHGVGFLAALDVAGRVRHRVGDHAAAAEIQFEALDLRRAGESEPDADHATDGPHLLVECLRALGRVRESLRIAREAVEIRRRDVRRHPRRHRRRLAAALTTLGTVLTSIGAHHEALAASGEALEISRRRYRDDPDGALADYATALVNHQVDLVAVGRVEEAGQVAGTVRELTAAWDRTDRGGVVLARLLFTTAIHLLGVDAEDALRAVDDALALHARLGTTDDAPARAHVVRGLILSDLGRHAEAVAACTTGVAGFRALAGPAPSVHGRGLLRALRLLSVVRHKGERPDDDVLDEAVAVSRALAALPTDVVDQDTVAEHLELAVLLHDRGREADAVDSDRRAVEAHPEASAAGHPVLAERAQLRGFRALEAGRLTESIALSRMGVEHFARLADHEGEVLGRENTYLALRAARRYPEAADELVALVRPLVQGGFTDRTRHYRAEIADSARILADRGSPVVRDWAREEDLARVVAERGADAVRATGVLLVDRGQDVLEVLGSLEAADRTRFLARYVEELRRWPEQP